MEYSTDKSSEITISFAQETMVDEVCVVQVTMRKKNFLNMVFLRTIL